MSKLKIESNKNTKLIIILTFISDEEYWFKIMIPKTDGREF